MGVFSRDKLGVILDLDDARVYGRGHTFRNKRARQDFNLIPLAPEANALSAELRLQMQEIYFKTIFYRVKRFHLLMKFRL